MKVGRNDLCPCGSGKKYKKCCLEKDRLELNAMLAISGQRASDLHEKDEWELETEDVLEEYFENTEENEMQDGNWDESLDEFDNDESENQLGFDEPDELEENQSMPEDELSMISEEENKLIDDWWEAYKEMDDTVQEREHLVAFMEKFPHLVEYLGLEEEVLFVLGDDHFRKGIYEVFVELLLRIRKEYPDVYKKSYAYYDFDMICWHVAQGRLEEISQFFDWFKQDKMSEYDYKLAELAYFLRATNHSDILLSELEGNVLSFPIGVDNTLLRYLDKPVSSESVRELMDEFASEGLEPDYIGEANDWNERLLRYTRPFSLWSDNLPKKRSQAMEYYLAITENFIYFLYKKTGLSFDSAEIYAETIYQYYSTVVSSNKRPKNVFCLDKETVANNLFIKTFHWLDSDVPCLTQLNAFYYYAAYLETCGNITEKQRQEFQEYITGIYRNYYSRVKSFGTDMLLFSQFPLWEMGGKDE